MRKLLLINPLSPGDVVVCSAAVRDLHLAHPGEFMTGYQGTSKEVFENSPYISRRLWDRRDMERLQMEYPAIHESNVRPVHFIDAYHEFLSEKLGVPIPRTALKGDIHLSAEEKIWASRIHEITGRDLPFWIIVSGGKFDYTLKWWGHQRYQAVVDAFQGRLVFAQVGEAKHHHPRLRGVLNLVGQTRMRQLIRLVHHSRGVVCPVTCLMHLAAAVETRQDQPGERPCVVIAGGREPVTWEHYPAHTFLHTLGQLPCCTERACWKSRLRPLGDRSTADEKICERPLDDVAECMSMITPDAVIQAIEKLHEEGRAPYLTPQDYHAFIPYLSK